MKVLNLGCSAGHNFEGWFASEDDFQSQLGRGLISCPLCADKTITKKLSAPRLNFGVSRESHEVAAQDPLESSASPQVQDSQACANDEGSSSSQIQAQWLNMVKHVISNTEDVGERFVNEARKMHYGETEHRNIRGQASPQQTQELLEEGIAVMPLPIPEALKGPLQ
jgi:hypothetical protein